MAGLCGCLCCCGLWLWPLCADVAYSECAASHPTHPPLSTAPPNSLWDLPLLCPLGHHYPVSPDQNPPGSILESQDKNPSMVSEALGSLNQRLLFPHSLPCSPPASFQLLPPSSCSSLRAFTQARGPVSYSWSAAPLFTTHPPADSSPSTTSSGKASRTPSSPTRCCIPSPPLAHMWFWELITGSWAPPGP